MAKVSVVVFADTDTQGDMGRVVNALLLAREARESGDEVEIGFDGAGVKWVGALAAPEHRLHRLYQSVRGEVTGVCEYCAGAFGAKEAVREAGIPFLSEFQGHPSLRARLSEGYHVVTF